MRERNARDGDAKRFAANASTGVKKGSNEKRFPDGRFQAQVETMAGDLEMDWLLKVRAVVARCGEMDAGKWWNTSGQLGGYGAKILKRGFPRTHYFAQARSVLAVASHRCDQIFQPLGGATLWRLTDKVEDEFDRKWESWLDDAENWAPFFKELAGIPNPTVVDTLLHFGLVTDKEIQDSIVSSKRSVDGRALRITGVFSCGRRTVAMLALGFGKAKVGQIIVPYAIIAIDTQRPTKGEAPPPDAPSGVS